MKKALLFIVSVLALSSFYACGTGPGEQPSDPGQALTAFEAAWEARNTDILSDCLAPEFIYVLPPEDWDDYSIPPDGIIDSALTRDLYMEYAGIVFYQADSISLVLYGDGQEIWPGDSTGESVIMTRQFQLDISYPDSLDSSSGEWDFIVRPEGEGWIIRLMELRHDSRRQS